MSILLGLSPFLTFFVLMRLATPGAGLVGALAVSSLLGLRMWWRSESVKILEVGSLILCLPLIRPIGSRRPSQVFVMESTYAWHCHHPALAWRLHTPRLGCVFSQG
jgi:hypothetical protein